MAISVTEKEHIKDLIEKRINAKIEQIQIENKADLDMIKEQAKINGIEALGLTETMATIESIDDQITKLTEKRNKLEIKALESLGVDSNRVYNRYREHINNKIATAAAISEKKLIDAHPNLKQISALKDEKENLLQTIWIATSNTQVKQLFDYLNSLLGVNPTSFEQMAQRIPPDQTT